MESNNKLVGGDVAKVLLMLSHCSSRSVWAFVEVYNTIHPAFIDFTKFLDCYPYPFVVRHVLQFCCFLWCFFSYIINSTLVEISVKAFTFVLIDAIVEKARLIPSYSFANATAVPEEDFFYKWNKSIQHCQLVDEHVEELRTDFFHYTEECLLKCRMSAHARDTADNESAEPKVCK
jgi:hypothetical protein